MTRKPAKPMTVTSRSVTVRDFLIFQAKLALDGLGDLVAFNLSIVAIILDFISGRGKRPRLFYSVVRASKRFDKWLDLHGVAERMSDEDLSGGLFEGVDDEEDSLVSEIERLVDKAKVKRPLKPGGDPSGGEGSE